MLKGWWKLKENKTNWLVDQILHQIVAALVFIKEGWSSIAGLRFYFWNPSTWYLGFWIWNVVQTLHLPWKLLRLWHIYVIVWWKAWTRLVQWWLSKLLGCVVTPKKSFQSLCLPGSIDVQTDRHFLSFCLSFHDYISAPCCSHPSPGDKHNFLKIPAQPSPELPSSLLLWCPLSSNRRHLAAPSF